MNIFVVNTDPELAAIQLCDKHINKMTVETVQMLVSASRRHGATDSDVPTTSKGTPHKGGYANHPSTVWAGDSKDNFIWLFYHGLALAEEFKYRYGKEHACSAQLDVLENLVDKIPDNGPTDVALCVGPELQSRYGATHMPIQKAVEVYQTFYRQDKVEFAKWEKGRPSPTWWNS